MAMEGFEQAEARHRRRRSKLKHRRRNRKREGLMLNLKWLLGGLAIGLPVLAAVTYVASRF